MSRAKEFRSWIVNIDMVLTENWASDWTVCKEDRQLSQKLIPIFECFLGSLLEKGVSKRTLRRHESACHALGGYIVGEVFGRGDESFSPDETGETVLLRFIDESGGPLVYQDEEAWQNDLDATCRKLFKQLKNRKTV